MSFRIADLLFRSNSTGSFSGCDRTQPPSEYPRSIDQECFPLAFCSKGISQERAGRMLGDWKQADWLLECLLISFEVFLYWSACRVFWRCIPWGSTCTADGELYSQACPTGLYERPARSCHPTHLRPRFKRQVFC